MLIVVAVLVVAATVVVLVAVVVDVSDAAVVRSGGAWVDGVKVKVVVRVACADTARVDERGPVCALDEVAACTNVCQHAVKPLIEWVVAVRK